MEEENIKEEAALTNEKLSKKDEKKAVNKKIEKLEEELKKALSDSNHWKNEYYKAYADTQNLRKSIEKDHREAMKYRLEGLISDLLPVLDGFHMALQIEPKNEEMKNFLIGFQFIYKNLVSVLENEGVKEISPILGSEFNANEMQAMDSVEDEGEENKVKNVFTKGYRLHDRLVRPAMVVVSKKPSPKHEEENSNEIQEDIDNKN